VTGDRLQLRIAVALDGRYNDSRRLGSVTRRFDFPAPEQSQKLQNGGHQVAMNSMNEAPAVGHYEKVAVGLIWSLSSI
jgi:hypothetical protein